MIGKQLGKYTIFGGNRLFRILLLGCFICLVTFLAGSVWAESGKIRVDIPGGKSASDSRQSPSKKSTSKARRDGSQKIEPKTGMEFVFVEGGCFRMGDTFGDGESNEKPAHDVCVGNFYIGKFEVTQGQWENVMGTNPSVIRLGPEHPVENVSWYDVKEFIRKFNGMTGGRFRLPTEAEWEYAARSGGKREKWAGTSNESSLADYAWFDRNSGSTTHPVGERMPNGLGLHDMSGNVWEWCSDWYGENYYASSPKIDPQGPSTGNGRVHRGGSWGFGPDVVRASFRRRGSPGDRDGRLGFRVVSSPQD